jgi:hypothetical protein
MTEDRPPGAPREVEAPVVEDRPPGAPREVEVPVE